MANIEVLLREHVRPLGKCGDVVRVKPGYARNYLLPNKLAIGAGTKSANLYAELDRQRDVRDEKRMVEARAEAARLNGVEINIPAQANEEDTLFGSITNDDVAQALAKAGHKVDKHDVRLEEHIKQLGKYDISIHVFKDVTATVKVWVVRP